MAVHQLGRETDVVRHHHARTLLVACELGARRKAHSYPAIGEQRVPERIVLVHVKATGNAYGNGRCALYRLAVEEQAVLLFVGVHAFFRLVSASVGKHPFATVARKVVLSVVKTVAHNETLVVAALAMERPRGVAGLRQHVVKPHSAAAVTLGVEGAAVCSHQFGHVATRHFNARQQLQGAHHGVVTHRSALHHDMFAKLGHVP